MKQKASLSVVNKTDLSSQWLALPYVTVLLAGAETLHVHKKKKAKQKKPKAFLPSTICLSFWAASNHMLLRLRLSNQLLNTLTEKGALSNADFVPSSTRLLRGLLLPQNSRQTVQP